MSNAVFERLPLHIVSRILSLLKTVRTLGRAILAHSLFHAAFQDATQYILRRILLSQMRYEKRTLYYALAANAASSVYYKNEKCLKHFISRWFGQDAPEPRQFVEEHWRNMTPKIAAALSETQALVNYFATDFRKRAGRYERRSLDIRDPEIGSGYFCEEVFRIHRALYLYQMYCTIYFRSLDDFVLEGRRSRYYNLCLQRTHARFFEVHAPWENEQIACVLDYLERELSIHFDAVAKSDTAWRWGRVDWGSKGSKNKFKQAYLSLGLRFLYTLRKAPDYASAYSILTKNVNGEGDLVLPPKADIMMASVMRTLYPRPEWGNTIGIGSRIKDLTASDLRIMESSLSSYISDGWDSDAAYLWRLSHWRLIVDGGLDHSTTYEARRCGYVMWNIRRPLPAEKDLKNALRRGRATIILA